MRQLRLELRNSEFSVWFSVLIEIYFGFSVLHDFLCGFSVSYRPQRPPREQIDGSILKEFFLACFIRMNPGLRPLFNIKPCIRFHIESI